MPKEAKEKAISEINKLKMMPPMSAEATVSRNYIDWILAVPWKKRSKVRTDLLEAEAILNEEHYGLEKVKERILEYLAVQQRVKKVGGPILCLVGPPGVGKTSLGQSIARATPENLYACLWAEYEMKPKYEGIVEPILVPCQAKFCKNWQKWVFEILYFY